jgi:hypothetical protein
MVAAAPRVSTFGRRKILTLSKPNALRRPVLSRNEFNPEEPPMRYVCLIYFDPRKVFNQSPEAQSVLQATGPHDAALKASGRLVTAEALTLPDQAVTVQVRDGKMSATDGPFMETKEMLAGFILIEARDLNEAIQIAAEIPFAKLGAIEVRPTVDFSKPRPTL